MTPAEILRDARQRILDPAHWCQFALYRNAEGRAISVLQRDEIASCCTMGALVLACESSETISGKVSEAAFRFLEDAANDLFLRSPPFVNDQLGHEATLQMFDRAIALAEGDD